MFHKSNAGIMTESIYQDLTLHCFVCDKIPNSKPVNIHSGLARSGSIHEKICEIVDDDKLSGAYQSSDIVCPRCLKLLLSINNLEFELKNLKGEFLGIFQLGIESRKNYPINIPVSENADVYSEKQSEEFHTHFAEDIRKESKQSDSLYRVHKTRTLSIKKECDNGTDIFIDSIKESFSDAQSPLSGKDPLTSEGSVDEGVIENKTIIANPLDDGKLLENVTHVLCYKQENAKPTLEKYNNKPSVSTHCYDNKISSSDCKNEEKNISFDFDNFETRLCSTITSEADSRRSCRRLSGKPRRAASAVRRHPKRRKITKRGEMTSDVDETSTKVSDAGKEHREFKHDGNKKDVRELCRDRLCKICGQFVGSATELAEHRSKIHGDIYKFICDKCPNVRYRHKAKLTQHFKLRHKVHIHQCPGCDVEETSHNSLDQHIINKHPESRFFECKICLKAFRTYRYLHCVHIKRCHVGLPVKYFCDKCQKGFVDKTSLNNHKYTHSKGKNYECEFCGALFHTPYSLKVHVNTHTKEKKYTCTLCGVSYLRLCNLIDHKKRVHHSQDKKYVCEICGTLLRTNRALIRHQLLSCQKDEKTFNCEKCEKVFASKKSLKEHLMVHHVEEKERPYICHCGKSYVNKCHLIYHLKAVHKGELGQQVVVTEGFVEEETKVVEEDNEDNVVVITVKECNPPPLYSVHSTADTPAIPNEVMISSDVPVAKFESSTLSESLVNTQGVELPLLHSPFGTIASDRLSITAPLLFTPLRSSPNNVHHAQEPVTQVVPASKLEPSIAHITENIQGTYPYHTASTTVVESGNQTAIQEEDQEPHTNSLATEILELSDMHPDSSNNSVPVTYITAWPS